VPCTVPRATCATCQCKVPRAYGARYVVPGVTAMCHLPRTVAWCQATYGTKWHTPPRVTRRTWPDARCQCAGFGVIVVESAIHRQPCVTGTLIASPGGPPSHERTWHPTVGTQHLASDVAHDTWHIWHLTRDAAPGAIPGTQYLAQWHRTRHMARGTWHCTRGIRPFPCGL
jgi:hypothetical protein